jgi:hypothetical protein
VQRTQGSENKSNAEAEQVRRSRGAVSRAVRDGGSSRPFQSWISNWFPSFLTLSRRFALIWSLFPLQLSFRFGSLEVPIDGLLLINGPWNSHSCEDMFSCRPRWAGLWKQLRKCVSEQTLATLESVTRSNLVLRDAGGLLPEYKPVGLPVSSLLETCRLYCEVWRLKATA